MKQKNRLIHLPPFLFRVKIDEFDFASEKRQASYSSGVERLKA